MSALFSGIKGLLGSEKAIAAGVLVVAATVLVITGKMSIAEWREYSLWCLGIYTGGKTIQGTAASIKGHAGAPSEAGAVAAEAVAAATTVADEIEANDSAADKALAEKHAAKGDK